MPSFPTVSPKLEVVARITIASLLTFILAVASIPHVVPPALSQLIGILGPSFCMSLPHVVFIMGAAFPSIITVIIFGLLGATALLAAATVSDGLFVAAFAMWALWCTGLGYGPDASKTASNANLLIAVAGLLSLGSWQLVQNGMRITVNFPYEHNEGYLADMFAALLQEICGDDPNCYEKELSQVSTPTPFIIPGSSDFSGQTAYLSCAENACTVTIPGGLWIVKGYWTWSGLENPLAVMRNFLIVLCWGLLCVALGRLLPPLRTARKMYSRALLPKAIRDATAAIKDSSVQDTKKEQAGASDKTDAEKEQRTEGLVHAAVQNASGGMAPLTAFEPRIFRNPFECTWPILKELATSVDNLTLYALGSELRQHFTERETEEDKAEFASDLAVLDKCSAALVADEKIDVDNLKEPKSKAGDEERGEFSFFVSRMNKMTENVCNNTVAWLEAMHHPKYTGMKDLAMSYAPWIVPIAVFFKRMFVALSLPFRPKRWNLFTFLVAAKFTIGVVILVVCEVYWTRYRGFAVGESKEVENDPAGPVTITLADAPNVYSGWNLLSYILATTPTMEGTVKKGFFRAVGTALGGFSAWIAIIACSGSYDQDADVNLYGLSAWLTVTTGMAAYLFIPNGPMAFFGLDPDSGMYGMYFAMTQALCALEIALGVGDRDVIVANRVVATVTGVLMAMIAAVIPPHVRGSDPKGLKDLLQMAEDAFEQGLRLLQEHEKEDTEAKMKELANTFLAEGQAKKKEEEFFLKDAAKLNSFYHFKVDPRLPRELDTLAVTGSYVLLWLQFASHVVADKDVTLAEAEKVCFGNEVNNLLKRLERMSSGEIIDGDTTPSGEKMIGSSREEPDLLLSIARFICTNLEIQERFFASFS